jgi:CheY-like chemotaxis protein
MAKVLVVDDDPMIRDVLSDVLSDEGHQVLTARDGMEALQALEREGNYLILLDLMMPRLDGPGVIRALEARPTVRDGNRIIVMSAAERLFALSALIASDLVRERVAKPFELDLIIELVARHAPPSPRDP